MSKTRFAYSLSIIAVLLLAFASCKPKGVTGDSGPKRSAAEVLESYKEHRMDFQTLSMKGKGNFSSPTDKQDFSFTYRINILRDSLIWASISKFGMEGMRLLASEDSVWVRNMVAQEGIRCDVTYLRKATGMNVDFEGLQSFLVGEIVGGTDGLRHVDGTRNPYEYVGTFSGYQMRWSLDGRTHKVVKVGAQEAILDRRMDLSWSDFKPVGKETFAHQIDVAINAAKTMNFSMSHSNVTLNEENINFNFSFPENYAIKNCMEASGGK